MPLNSPDGSTLQWSVGRNLRHLFSCLAVSDLLWTPAQRKRAFMLYFANVFIYLFFMAALFSGPG